ncbi:undecaprenyl-diphosphatase [Cyclobacterium lianum]|uniref:Undecaprenyl-diphosphatase n=1 Tax=Cyclobacterium lianum TaxID=388280 RepID=A0A1M7NAU2_9BACT|nr:phosphatase PAP2 family protein [Cyclobacterium lianum]SHN00735.1 undecaprenyl-diphosphatase [Cyclobacterium lianum]
MIEKLKAWDEALFLFLNQLHLPWLDPVMLALTGRFIWTPLYIFLVYLLVKTYKKDSVWYILGLVLAVVLADQLTSGFMKPFFERLRPCHDARWEAMVRNYAGCGGRYGFASSHAANTFALAAYLWKTSKAQINGIGWLFLWAAIVSYTRIYLGVHYPLDILVGALVGAVLAWLVAWLSLIARDSWKRKTDSAATDTP